MKKDPNWTFRDGNLMIEMKNMLNGINRIFAIAEEKFHDLEDKAIVLYNVKQEINEWSFSKVGDNV